MGAVRSFVVIPDRLRLFLTGLFAQALKPSVQRCEYEGEFEEPEDDGGDQQFVHGIPVVWFVARYHRLY